MAAVKSYMLAPNFTYHPNTSICIGDIIQDPSDPTKPLSSPSDLGKLDTVSHLDYDVSLSSSSSSSLKGSVWAKFLETAQARIGGGVSGDVLDRYTMTRLETIYFRKQPTDEEAEARVKDSKKIQAAMNAGIVGKKPVFMITGLKVARGFRVRSGHDTEASGQVTAEAPIADGIGAGVDLEARKSHGTYLDMRTAKGQDIVFAYQLHLIAQKGWRKQVDISVHRPKAGFLSNDRSEITEEPLEVLAAGLEDMSAYDEEMPVDAAEARDGDEECVCLVFPE